MAIALTILLVVLFSFQSLFLKLFSAHYQGEKSSAVFNISYGFFAGIATLIVTGFRFSPSTTTWVCGLLNAVTLLLYNLSMMKASRKGSYAFQMIAMLFGGIVVPMLHSVIFLGESLNALQCVAVALMLASFVLMNLKGLTLKGSEASFLLWCLLLFVVNGLYSVLMNLQQELMAGQERNEMVVLTFLGMSALCVVFQGARDPKGLLQGFKMPRKPLAFLLGCCLCATIASHLMLYLLTQLNATVLYTINNGGVLMLSVVYSCVLFREKLNRWQLGGIALSLVSIVMLSL